MHSSPITDPGPVPYTLRIGVTGHRDLADEPMVEASVEKLLMQIKTSLESGMKDPNQPVIQRNTGWQKFEGFLNWRIRQALAFLKIIPGQTEPERQTELKWEIYSSLARGADRIVARSAMDKLGAGLIAILPTGLNQYIKDFKDQADLEELKLLVQKSVNYASLLEGYSPYTGSPEDKYEQAGKAVVDSCEILVAIWDGKPARGPGGTANIIRYARSVHHPVVWIDTRNPGSIPVMVDEIQDHKGTPGNSPDNSIKVTTNSIPAHACGWSYRFLQVSEYNRDRSFKKNVYNRHFQSYRNKFLEACKIAGLPSDLLEPLIEKILPHYTRADYLATQYHKLHMLSAIWLYRLSAIAVTVAVIQTLYFPAHTVWVAVEILALVIAVIWFRFSLIGQWHDKWLAYRHLAERTRIRLIKSLAGRPTSTEAPQNLQLPFYSSPGGWVLDVFAAIQHEIPEVVLPGEMFPEVRSFISKGWILDQAAYHSKNAIEKENKVKNENRLIGILLALTLAAAIVHLFGLIHHPYFENFIIAMVIVLPAFAAAQHAMGSVRDFERIAARSSRMKEILQNIDQRIQNASNWNEINTVITNAEEIMSTENLEWSASLSFRRISLPV